MEKISRVYLTIEVREPWMYKTDQERVEKWFRWAEKLEAEINHYCKHLDDLGDIRVHSERTCEFCKCIFEKDDDGTPLCCNKALKEYEENKAKETEQHLKLLRSSDGR